VNKVIHDSRSTPSPLRSDRERPDLLGEQISGLDDSLYSTEAIVSAGERRSRLADPDDSTARRSMADAIVGVLRQSKRHPVSSRRLQQEMARRFDLELRTFKTLLARRGPDPSPELAPEP
jgi:hypothetical protein